ncbi:MAG: EAL domain-containing protein [Lachnospiraceae bacterium]|nr:EAL domain-containing protein [Lachnospiraceae bacterium]
MGDSLLINGEKGNEFLQNLFGGACVWRADPPNDFLFISRHLINLYECKDEEEFLEYTGGTFPGAVGEDYQQIRREIDLQLNESPSRSGYVFFNIITKKGNVRRIVNHFSLVEDPDEGIVFYVNLFLHKEEIVGSDFDSITGLYGKLRLAKYYSITQDKAELPNAADYALIYLNIVNFRLLNIEKGVAEGDRCLSRISDILRETYKNGYIARISDDHFAILDVYDGILEKTLSAEKTFDKTYGARFDVKCKFGIYKIDFINGDTLESSLNFAKLASDFIKNNDDRNVVEYSTDIAKQIQTRTYVVDNLDEALESGWIKVYFQPVVRTLTGNLCGMESLVRWIDPVMGFLRPDQFISALESEKLIHKVDSYMVEQVCKILHDKVASKKPIVPVSINFSRIDFILCDMLSIVEAAVKKYKIPRDYLHIEITESMIASDEELMRNVIKNFRDAGYEVWMDDFGSGYSSLTLLKDYDFDMLKLDMKFLSDLGEKSRSIVSSTISMAKDIGIKTLAEGVETEEQLQFLSDVGCGMIQGYYYGKPEPIDDVFEHLCEKTVPVELRKWRHFYEEAGRVARVSDYPLEVIEFDGKKFRTLFMNSEYKQQVGFEGLDLEEIDRKTYDPSSPLYHIYLEIAEKLKNSDEEETFFFPVNSSYYCFSGERIAHNSGRIIIRGSITNISNDPHANDETNLDDKLRELSLLFEEVLLLNINERTLTPILGTNKFLNSGKSGDVSLRDKAVERSVRDLVHPDDLRRCSAFMHYDTLKDRMGRADKGYLEDAFRIKREDGNYEWTEHYIMQIPGTNGAEYLFCLKRFTPRDIDRLEEATELLDKKDLLSSLEALTIEHADVMENILRSASLGVFWKDMDLRFRGASKTFNEYFKVYDERNLMGRTAEEMGWLIDSKKINKVEQDVIKKGRKLMDEFQKVMVGGEIRTVMISRMPLYRSGKIVGLVGYFLDWDEELKRRSVELPLLKDADTGLPNAHAFIDALIDFSSDYKNGSVNYAIIIFNNLCADRIVQTYGEDTETKVMRRMGEIIRDEIGASGMVARTRDTVLSALVHIDSKKDLDALMDKLVRQLEGINEVEGNAVTMMVSSAAKLRSSSKLTDEELYEKTMKSVLNDKKK